MKMNTAIVERLQNQTATLDAKTAALNTEANAYCILYNHAVNSRNSILARGRMCSVVLYDDFTIASTSNAHSILGPVQLRAPITSALDCPEARDYFDSIRRVRNDFIRLSDLSAGVSWTRVFPTTGDPAGLATWMALPARTWDIQPDQARVIPSEDPGKEHYLISPVELIGPAEDFRIEYSARAEGQPRDLSLVVGTGLASDVVGVHGDRPDADGYCFAFGSMDNRSTELQRALETVVSNGNVLIESGREHHAVAERIGGELRFTVDNRVAYTTIDCLPLLGPGRGFVGFYTCSPGHCFSKLSVWTRPTCIPPEIMARICSLRTATFESIGPFRRTVEAHYLGKTLFLFRDITPGSSPHPPPS